MSATISQRQLRNESGDIFRRLQDGEEFVVTSRGRPIAELRPLNSGDGGSRREATRPLDLSATSRIKSSVSTETMLQGLRDDR